MNSWPLYQHVLLAAVLGFACVWTGEIAAWTDLWLLVCLWGLLRCPPAPGTQGKADDVDALAGGFGCVGFVLATLAYVATVGFNRTFEWGSWSILGLLPVLAVPLVTVLLVDSMVRVAKSPDFRVSWRRVVLECWLAACIVGLYFGPTWRYVVAWLGVEDPAMTERLAVALVACMAVLVSRSTASAGDGGRARWLPERVVPLSVVLLSWLNEFGTFPARAADGLTSSLVGIAPAPFGLWAMVVALVGAVSVVAIVASTPAVWTGPRAGPMNRFALVWLKGYFAFDRRGAWSTRVRHWGHRFAGSRLSGVLRTPIRIAFGVLPEWLVPESPERGRIERFTEYGARAARDDCDQAHRDVRAARLGARVSPTAEAELQRDADRFAAAHLVLLDLLDCPRCVRRRGLPPELWMEWQVPAVSVLLCTEFASEQGSRSSRNVVELRDRVRENLTSVDADQVDSPGGRFLADSAVWLLQLIDARLLDGVAIDELSALEAEHEVVRAMAEASEANADWRKVIACALLRDRTLRSDWEGAIELGQQLAGVVGLGSEHRLELGEAWWMHAASLSDDRMRDWARENALSEWGLAESPRHLELSI